MRARTREVNIFNMSLLDILCGALGAFCFMMLVLLPYYKPPTDATDLRNEQQNTDQLLKELEKLKEAAKNSEFAKQMEELVNKLQEQVKQLQGEVNQYASQNAQLQSQTGQLRQENQYQKDQLAIREPFIVTLIASVPQAMIIYLDSDQTNEGKKAPPFDPEQPQQATFWKGDITMASDKGVTIWMVRDSNVGTHYKLYVKPLVGSATRVATSVQGHVDGPNNDWSVDLPKVTLTPTRYWTLVGTLTKTPDGKLTFAEASQQERDAEWTKLSKGKPPPAIATPASSGPGARMSKDDMDRLREESRKQREAVQKQREEQMRRRQQQQPPSASPAGSTAP